MRLYSGVYLHTFHRSKYHKTIARPDNPDFADDKQPVIVPSIFNGPTTKEYFSKQKVNKRICHASVLPFHEYDFGIDCQRNQKCHGAVSDAWWMEMDRGIRVGV